MWSILWQTPFKDINTFVGFNICNNALYEYYSYYTLGM